MKVGIVTEIMDDRPAGMGQYVRNLVGAMLELDSEAEITLVHAQKGGDPLYDRTHELVVKGGILKGRASRKFIHYPRALKKAGFDVVHYPDFLGPFPSRMPFRVVETIHDLVHSSIATRRHHSVVPPRRCRQP